MADEKQAANGEGRQPDAPEPAAAPAEGAAEPVPAEPDWKDLYLRAVAELDNYRKRQERERAAQAPFASEPVLRKLLDPVESLDRALDDLENVARETPEASRAPVARSLEGLRALRRQFRVIFESEGVTSLGEAGVPFDPQLHEALVTLPSTEHPEGHVAQVIQPGYLLRGRVMRPARVAVSSGPPAPEAEGPAEGEPRPPRTGLLGKRRSPPEANPSGHAKNNENK